MAASIAETDPPGIGRKQRRNTQRCKDWLVGPHWNNDQGRLVGRLVGWLAGWLAGWLVVVFGAGFCLAVCLVGSFC